jgi:arylsulfatase A-like enzyme
LVWFFSDNGGTGAGINRPLRGAKGSVFEGGIHVVAALRWPERIPAGGKITAPLGYIDVLPTLMRVTGVKDHGGKPLDGIDAFDVLMGKKKTVERDMYSYIGQQGEQTEKITLIEMKWKLVVNGLNVTAKSSGKVQRQILLFDIEKDPNETTNRANEQPQVVERMFAKLKSFRSLQPANAVPAYRKRDPNFKPPHEWKIAD